LFSLVAMQVSAGPAWRWVDADGTVHYSDRPVPGAVEVYLPDANAPAPAAQSSTTTAASAPVTTTVPLGANAQYTQLAIASPVAEQTLWNTGGTLNIDVAVGPRVQQGHRLGLIYDGELLNLPPSSGTSFTLDDVFRGIHTVQAVILDANNTQVLRSAPVQFMVQQTSLLNPNNPNNPTRRN
jgi:hypothetical protein